MHIHRILLFVTLILFCASPHISGQNYNSWEVGDTLLVNWSGDIYWYPATIQKKDRDRYFVHFDDGDKEWTNRSRMIPEDITVGDQVFGNWKGKGKYYRGKVTSRNGKTIHINYDDGDKETTTISFVRVIRPRN